MNNFWYFSSTNPIILFRIIFLLLGLKYRSCHEGVVHEDGFIAITRGFAHTSPIPFDVRTGWFRENRVLSGDIYYECVPILVSL